MRYHLNRLRRYESGVLTRGVVVVLCLVLIPVAHSRLPATKAQPLPESALPMPDDISSPIAIHYLLTHGQGNIFLSDKAAKDVAYQMQRMIKDAGKRPNLNVDVIDESFGDKAIWKRCPQQPCELVMIWAEKSGANVFAHLEFKSKIPALSKFKEHELSERAGCPLDNNTAEDECLAANLSTLVKKLIDHNNRFHGGH